MERKEALTSLLKKVEAGDDIGILSNGLCDFAFCAGDLKGTAYQAFHGSLDCAKALHEAVLPGWHWGIEDNDQAEVFKEPVWDGDSGHWAPGPSVLSNWCDKDNPARAWLIAILRALIAEEDDG